MVFEAPGDNADTVGDQRRGHRITGISLHPLAVVIKRKRFAAVDETTLGKSIRRRVCSQDYDLS